MPISAHCHLSVQVTSLLNNYLAKFRLAPVFSQEEVRHWFRSQENVLYAYVVEEGESGQTSASSTGARDSAPVSGGGRITDLISFYTLPLSVLMPQSEGVEIKGAYQVGGCAHWIGWMQGGEGIGREINVRTD